MWPLRAASHFLLRHDVPRLARRQGRPGWTVGTRRKASHQSELCLEVTRGHWERQGLAGLRPPPEEALKRREDPKAGLGLHSGEIQAKTDRGHTGPATGGAGFRRRACSIPVRAQRTAEKGRGP